ncbi:hypothetical protein [Streptomyces sp. NPDC006355]
MSSTDEQQKAREEYRRAQERRNAQSGRDDGNIGALGRRPGQNPGGGR